MVDKLISLRKQILFIELGGLLHDIGKLSKKFLEYRQMWQSLPDGYNIDPHEKNYLGSHETFVDLVPAEFNKTPVDIDFSKPDFSIKKAIDFHIKPGKDLILELLKTADRVDSAIDRNNPLWSAEQKDRIFKSNVFGYEGNKVVTFESQEKARQELYASLRGRLPDYFEHFDSESRVEILKEVKKAFDQGLADTTRPQNDTTLWEHSYAVASILKVLAVHYILCNEKLDTREKVKFGIFGIGWDGMRFLSYGQKIGDIIGRKNVIENTKKSLRELIEYEYPIGNEIYSDDDGIYFIVPAGFDKYGEINGLGPIRSTILEKIHEIAAEISSGELQPHIVDISETNTLTSLVRAIREMKEKVSYPFDSSVDGFQYFKVQLEAFENNKPICPVCRLRSVEKEDDKKKVCKTCRERRTLDDGTGTKERNETLFIDEIVDKNRRAALIVARFGLGEWLNGKMVRSLFITEANGLEREVDNLGNVKQFECKEREIKELLKDRNYGEFNYGRITGDIDALFKRADKERAGYTAFLYDRRSKFDPDIEEIKQRWEQSLSSAQKEDQSIDIYTLVNAKTPTPSTLLDVWNTTLAFFKDKAKDTLRALLPENKRLKITIIPETNQNLKKWGKGTLEAEILGTTPKKIELLYAGDNTVEIVGEIFSDRSNSEWKGRLIRITDGDYKGYGNPVFKVDDCLAGDPFVTFRTITATPNLFIAIVPADMAVEITDLIYRKYIEQFGKVMGRLPFSIGNIFFGRKMPMFVVLDAGKRMVDNFDKLSKECKQFTVLEDKKDIASDAIFTLKCSLGKSGRSRVDKTVTWRLPSKLGNCEDDFHHPYFIVDNKTDLPENRKTFFKTNAGSVIHFSEIEAGDELLVYLNYYDFEFLDTNTRRYDINLDTDERRKSNVADFKSKPFLLDELSQKIMCLWHEHLQGKQLRGITDTKLRNLQTLWLTKYQEWEVDICNKSSENYKRWIDLVLSSIQKEFDTIDIEHFELLQETIENGLFFDALELYLGILRERIETE